MREDPCQGFGQLLLAPTFQASPQVVGVESNHLANVLKREAWGVLVVGGGTGLRSHHPFAGLAKKALAVTVPGDKVFLVAIDSVFEHRDDELPFTFLARCLPADCSEKLRCHNRFGLEDVHSCSTLISAAQSGSNRRKLCFSRQAEDVAFPQ